MPQCVKNNIDLAKFIGALDLPGPMDHPLKKILKRNGIKYRAVSYALNISPGMVSQVLNGKVRPSPGVEFNLKCLGNFIEKYGVDIFRETLH
jgi:hypothetical protein